MSWSIAVWVQMNRRWVWATVRGERYRAESADEADRDAAPLRDLGATVVICEELPADRPPAVATYAP